MALEVTILGSGTSTGVPAVACRCRVCRSDDPRDKRMRPSVLVRYASDQALAGFHESMERPPDAVTDHPNVLHNFVDSEPACNRVPPSEQRTVRQFLIDTGPDMRYQLTGHDVGWLDGVFFTHAHADHIAGLDDLRRFNIVMKESVRIYAEKHTFETVRSMFRYIFDSQYNPNNSFVASLDIHLITLEDRLDLFGAKWTPIRLMHGRLHCLGYRIDYHGHSVAYCTDVSLIPEESYPLLEGLDILILDGLRHAPHPTHFNIDQACREIEKIKPKRAYLTHLTHDVKHAEVEPTLPEHVYLAYDGLTLKCGDAKKV